MIEEFPRRSVTISKGNPIVFLSRPISAGMLIDAVGLLLQ